jgi:hypothetical protein
VPGTAQQAMYVVGVIEIAAGLLVAVAPRIGALVVSAWLAGIVLNLLTIDAPRHYDVALRDVGLLLAALTLGRLAWAVERVPATAGAGAAAPGWPAVLDGEQSFLGEAVEVEGGDPAADAEGFRGRVAADRRPGTGDQVEHGPPGRIVEGGQGADTVGERARGHDPSVKHEHLDFRSELSLASNVRKVCF